ncbi:transmembrane protein 115 [Contarinia nasturtii]|uniref:transmembrane protein 115 n=1 Tax=Contarinia nasturtii TaxID=265458 RepID=UPI0012D460C1|nr:transmembrane protein 115 [Contarinia nasturtii]
MATRTLSRNLPYINQQISALLVNTSPSVKFICIVTIFGYLLSFSETAIKALSVTPGYILPPQFCIWTAFTFCFLELYLWEVFLDIIIVGLCGKLIEPLWGQMEMMTFFAITNLGVAILSSMYYLFVYFCTKDDDLLFNVHIHGLSGYVAAVCVAVRQIMPDLLIAKTRIGKLTNRNMPLIVVFFSIIFWLCGILDGTTPTMFISGLIVSWIYLRFYQLHANGNRGDGSESFTFASFFPTILQPAISALVNPLHNLFLRIGIVKPHAVLRNSAHSLTSVVSVQNVDMHDMERRRQIALKALSERLSRTTDSSRQKILPKSFPHHHNHQGHAHGHGHHHNFSDSSQPPFIASQKVPVEFTIPAIPLPPPPSMVAPAQQYSQPTEPAAAQSTTNTLIDLGTPTEPPNNS